MSTKQSAIEAVAAAVGSYLYPPSEGYPQYEEMVHEATDILHSCARAAILGLRQWMDAEGLVVVPKKCTDDMAGYAGARAEARGDIRMLPGEYRDAWEAMIYAAPDPDLGDGP
jgi:hypothetical protein